MGAGIGAEPLGDPDLGCPGCPLQGLGSAFPPGSQHTGFGTPAVISQPLLPPAELLKEELPPRNSGLALGHGCVCVLLVLG